MKRNKRNCDNDYLKVSLAKSMYWLGTYLFFNHFVDIFWDRALQDQVWGDFELKTSLTDSVFNASVNAVMRKYMTGQATIAVDVENQSWLPRSSHVEQDEKKSRAPLAFVARGGWSSYHLRGDVGCHHRLAYYTTRTIK